MAMEFTSGPMEVSTKETGTRIKSPAMENTTGMMAVPIKATGSTIICTDKEFTNGLTAVSMKVNTSMTRSTAMEFTLIQTADLTKVNGQMANSTEKACSSPLKEPRGKESGTKARGLSGSMTRKSNNLMNICKIKTTIIERLLIS